MGGSLGSRRSGVVGRGSALVLAALAALATMVVVPQSGSAQPTGLGIAVTPVFDSPVVVGEQDQPALIQFVNGTFGTAAAFPVAITNIRINTSCDSGLVIGDPAAPTPCPVPEPRPDPTRPVLALDPVSGPGTTCPGGPFAIVGPDAEGDYIIQPTTAPAVTLAPVGQPGSSCVIQFTFDVLQRPFDGETAAVVSVVATSLQPPPGTPPPTPQTGSTTVIILQATPTMETLVSVPAPPGGGTPSVPPGTTFTDTATVTGVPNGPTPTGTVTFTVFHDPPGAAPCSGPATNLGASPLTGPPPTPPTPPTATATSAPVTATTPGTYRFVATYSGDTNYAPLGPTPCGAPGENVTVTQLQLQMRTQASTNATNVPPGTAVTDQAILTPPAGGPAPTGTVTYTLVGPNPDPQCTGPVVGTSTVPAGQPSAPFNPTLPGTYNFVATYSGDVNYEPINTPVGCGDPAEIFAIPRQPVQLVTQASTNSTNVMPGTQVTDVATVTQPAGFPAPTGTVTYTLVGPNPNANCTAPVVGTPSTVPVG
ncbi:MAG: Ig-like domain repeat protein, partial [Actinomycetota bacterium]|nr:Ig-like domain repeat protein [Actinomycetota bacterium]